MIQCCRLFPLALILSLSALFFGCAPRQNAAAPSSDIQPPPECPVEVQPEVVVQDEVPSVAMEPSFEIPDEDSVQVRSSWKNFQFAIQAMEDMEWLVAKRYLDMSSHELGEESKDSSGVDSAYFAEMPLLVKSAMDEVLLNLPDGARSQADSVLDGVEVLDSAQADELARRRLQQFLDTLDVSQFSLPVEFNERVLQEIYFFTGSARGFISGSLNRKTAFDSLIYAKIEAANMPKDLIYLSLVESGFKVRAYSRAKASGLWQFIPETGKRYGVDVDFWLDQRRNPEMATDAALKYLSDLYSYFGDWQLAMAAYNCGEGRVRRLIRELKADTTRDSTKAVSYWELALPSETMHYVPRILAAMVIGHYPEQYGIEVKPQKLSPYDTVTVYDSFSLDEIAKNIKVKPDTLKGLNAELIMGFTPPNRESYVLRVPVGKRDLFVKNYDKMEKNSFSGWVHHKVKKGESVGKIAQNYGIKSSDILQANNLKKMKIRPGQTLLIPIRVAKNGEDKSNSGSKKSAKPKIYIVKLGDNLATIAQKFNVAQENIRIWNSMDVSSIVAVGDTIFVSKPDMKPSSGDAKSRPALGKGRKYQVQSGDSYGLISQIFDVPVGVLLLANKGYTKRLTVGDSIVIPKYERKIPQAPATKSVDIPESSVSSGLAAKSSSGKVEPVSKNDKKAPAVKPGETLSLYTVESGDNLGYISMLFGISVSRLQELNGMGKSTDIRVGQKLYVVGEKKSISQKESKSTDKSSSGKDAKKDDKKTEKKSDKKDEKKSAESFRKHTVKKGEGLWDIARQYKVTIAEIVEWNNLPDTKIKEGAVLKIKKK